MLIETKLRKVGGSVVLTIPAAAQTAIHAAEGDTVYMSQGPEGVLKISRYNPEVVAALRAADRVMDANAEALQALA